VAEEIPASDTEGATQGTDIVGVVLEEGFEWIGGCLRGSAPTLIIQNDLSPGGQWGERRPEERVVVEQPAVHE
jgi:hypothetical protein